jgi:inorganic phosphate transporter, PiT family
MSLPPAFLLLLVVTSISGFFDGFHGGANVVATVISSRAMAPRAILLLAGVAEFVGPFLFGVAVAETIGKGLADPRHLTMPVVTAAVLAAIAWKIITWRLGLPSSSSHALLGGLVGAITIGSGMTALHGRGLSKVAASLILSPLLGLFLGHLAMKAVFFLARGATPRINQLFRRGQWVTTVILALSHSTNDAQKSMGVLALGLVATGMRETFEVPLWVVASSAGAIALGTMVGSRRLIKTIGGKFYKIRPVHSFTAQATSGAVILTAALLGGPVSTTQVVSSTIIGVGSAERLNKVRWRVLYDIALAWFLTIPATAIMAVLLYWPIHWLVGVLA